jgi:hypothetical protein
MNKKSFFQLILFGLFVFISFVSCDKDYNEIGADIVGDDHFGFQKYTGAFIKSYNQKLGPIASNNLAVNPLGFYDNPAFGTTQANFVTQIEMATPNPTFNNTNNQLYVNLPAIDSVVMEIPYFSKMIFTDTDGKKTYKLDSIYGIEASKFKLSVYRSHFYLRNLDPNESLGATQLFYTDKDAEIDNNKIPVLLNDLPTSDPRNADGHQNSQFYFDKREHKTKTYEADGTTEIPLRTKPSMRLHLNTDVFNAVILNAPSGQLDNNEVFKNYFRGIYFKTESIGNPGNMASLNFKEGNITVFYKEDKITPDDPETSENEYKLERIKKTFVLNLKGNTISLLNNTNENVDYTNASNNPSQEASQLFLKGGQGSISVIDIFGPDANNNGIADEIEVIKANGWLVNEANLTFYVDKLAMSDARSIEPNRIFLYDLNNKKMVIDYIFDGTTNVNNPKFNKSTFGGILEKENVTGGRGVRYKIRITNHVKNLINRDSTNIRLGLSITEDISNVGFSKLKTANTTTNSAPAMSVMSPLGTILFGSSPLVPDDKRLKLEIYYTKPD